MFVDFVPKPVDVEIVSRKVAEQGYNRQCLISWCIRRVPLRLPHVQLVHGGRPEPAEPAPVHLGAPGGLIGFAQAGV